MKNKEYDREHIAFLDIAIFENTAWFCNIGYNALFQLDLSTGIVKLLDFFPNDRYLYKEIYSPIAYLENKLYIAPKKGKELLIYDLQNSCFTSIELDLEKYGEEKNYNLFNHIDIIQGKVYLFPGRFHAIVEFDPSSQIISYIDDGWYEELSKRFRTEESCKMIFHDIHIDEKGDCFLPCWKSRDILKINVCTRKYEILTRLPEVDNSLSDAVELNGKILFSYKDEGGIWSNHNQNILTMKKLQFTYTGGLFFNTYKEWLYVIPLFGEAIIRYNFITRKCEEIYKFPEKKTAKNRWIPYKSNTLCRKKIAVNQLAIYSSFDGRLILADMDMGQTQIVELKLNEQDEKTIEQYFYSLVPRYIVRERVQFNLKDFISVVKGIN